MKTVLKSIFAISIALLIGCGKDGPAPGGGKKPEPPKPEVEGIKGDLSAIKIEAGKTYTVTGDLNVPEGKSVTIPAGTRFEFAIGPKNEAWVINVNGSLYAEGTKDKRVVFTGTKDAIASPRNVGFGGLWGGIHAGRKADDLVFEFTDILHAGGIAREGNIMTTEESGGSGRLKPGDVNYALYYCRPKDFKQDGVFILWNSKIAFTGDDAIRTNGGKTLMAYNVFEVVGQKGGEGVNIKAGGSGDYAFNLFYSMATNALKSADTQAGTAGNLETNFYNNTIIGSGFRRTDPGRGGSLNYESDAYGKAYNNIIVNCRYGLRLNAGESEPRKASMKFGHNWYFGQVDEVANNFYPTGANDPSRGLIGTELEIPKTDKIGKKGENNPQFATYDVTTFKWENRENKNPMPANADFRLQANSPALTGGKTDFAPKFATYETKKKKVFTTPKPAAHFGAYGSK